MKDPEFILFMLGIVTVLIIFLDFTKTFILGAAIIVIYFIFSTGATPSVPTDTEKGIHQKITKPVKNDTRINQKKSINIHKEIIIEEDDTDIRIDIYIHKGTENTSKNNISPRDTYKVNNPASTRELVNRTAVDPDYCNTLKFKGSKYVVIEGYYDTEEELLERYRLLRSRNISGLKMIWLPCYNIDQEQFAIIFGRPCKSLTSAGNHQDSFQERLNNENLLKRLPKVIPLERVGNKNQFKKEGEFTEGFSPSFFKAHV